MNLPYLFFIFYYLSVFSPLPIAHRWRVCCVRQSSAVVNTTNPLARVPIRLVEAQVPDGKRGGAQVAASLRHRSQGVPPERDPRGDGRLRRAAVAREHLGDRHAARRAGQAWFSPHYGLLQGESSQVLQGCRAAFTP